MDSRGSECASGQVNEGNVRGAEEAYAEVRKEAREGRLEQDDISRKELDVESRQ